MEGPSLIKKSIRLGLDKSPLLPSIKELFSLSRLASKREKYLALSLLTLGAIAILFSIWSLSASYLVAVPSNGGSFTEGAVGTSRFINPLLATSDVDKDLVALVYSGLLRANSGGNYDLDLAESYSISDDGTIYTIVLKETKWHDGVAVSADDVVYTIRLAQNSLINSPKRANWEGVTVERVDTHTVRFILQAPYAPFLENLTLGILPEHLWKSVPPEEFALNNLNQSPTGTGAYKISITKKDSSGVPYEITLKNSQDFIMGAPYIDSIIFRFYTDESKLLDAFAIGEIDSMAGISVEAGKVRKANKQALISVPLPRVFAVFYNQNQSSILADPAIRRALELGLRKEDVITFALSGFGSVALDALGTTLKNGEKSPYDQDLAKKLLEDSGWKLGDNGYRAKKSKPLELTLATADNPDLVRAASLIADSWKELGVKVNIKMYESSDLNTNIIRPRKFDALLIGQGLGHFPDPYAFWHSLQRLDPGLNVAQYTNSTADKALERARREQSNTLRKEQLALFNAEVASDRPALFLYVPHYIYVPPANVQNINIMSTSNPSDRFLRVHKWYINTDKVWSIFSR